MRVILVLALWGSDGLKSDLNSWNSGENGCVVGKEGEICQRDVFVV